jgi:hypothetical protein
MYKLIRLSEISNFNPLELEYSYFQGKITSFF